MIASYSAYDPTIIVIGLGYVGLPLAIGLAHTYTTIGLDIDSVRIEELAAGIDRTGTIGHHDLIQSRLLLSARPEDCSVADLYIVTVPTPVDAAKLPDLTLIRRATEMVARMIDPAKSPIVVYESTVYPGVTEGICGPILETVSGLRRGRDFFLGYSPERINPGDGTHTIDRITKVVAGESPEITERLCAVYDKVTRGGTFPAASIAIAEAAKVIENAQRDINIAFVNEVAQIVGKLGLSVWDVLETAATKWNFLPFQPGLVGGHCIGVDPYYLSYCAEAAGHTPAVILAGRATNDRMADWVADQLCEGLAPGARILVLGLTFKENVPDLRNSQVAPLAARFVARGHNVDVHDPLAIPAEAAREFGIVLLPDLPAEPYDVVLLAVAHDIYRALAPERLAALLKPAGVFGDLKNVVPQHAAFESVRRWRL